jgi:hypothetical protein
VDRRAGADLAEAAAGGRAHAGVVVLQGHAQGGDALVLAADVAESPRGGATRTSGSGAPSRATRGGT